MNSVDILEKMIIKLNKRYINYSDTVISKDFIYHYTSQNSLYKIIDSKALLLSHALDMNDPNEIKFGKDYNEP